MYPSPLTDTQLHTTFPIHPTPSPTLTPILLSPKLTPVPQSFVFNHRDPTLAACTAPPWTRRTGITMAVDPSPQLVRIPSPSPELGRHLPPPRPLLQLGAGLAANQRTTTNPFITNNTFSTNTNVNSHDNVSTHLTLLRKRFKKLSFALATATSHFSYLQECQQRRLTPPGLRTNRSCQASSKDLTDIDRRFNDLLRETERNLINILINHYVQAQTQLVQLIHDNQTETAQITTQADPNTLNTHVDLLNKTKVNIEKFKRKLHITKLNKIRNLTSPNRLGTHIPTNNRRPNQYQGPHPNRPPTNPTPAHPQRSHPGQNRPQPHQRTFHPQNLPPQPPPHLLPNPIQQPLAPTYRPPPHQYPPAPPLFHYPTNGPQRHFLPTPMPPPIPIPPPTPLLPPVPLFPPTLPPPPMPHPHQTLPPEYLPSSPITTLWTPAA